MKDNNMSIVTIYSVIWNEEVRLPHFIKHYRSRFPGCQIVLFDNKSTDKTPKIALDNNCIIVSFNTNNLIRDEIYKQIKNDCWRPWVINKNPWECWHHWSWTIEDEKSYLENNPNVKKAVAQGKFSCGMVHFFSHGGTVPNRPVSSIWECKTDWCIVVDCDEFLEADENLLSSANFNFNIIRSNFFEMYGDNNDIDSIDRGMPGHVKTVCWKAKDFSSIGYKEGAHICSPQPAHGKTIIYNTDKIHGYHFKWISYEYVMNRYKTFHARDAENLKKGWGIHTHFPDHQQLSYYMTLKTHSVKVKSPYEKTTTVDIYKLMQDVKIYERGFWHGANVHKYHGHSTNLAKWIVDYLSNEKDIPVYDLGCGVGFYLQELKKVGFTNLTGYEGDIPHHGKVFNKILQHDITLPLYNLPQGNVICLEVGEHIPGHFQHYFLENLKNLCNNKLILSWAVRGQPGHGHFHCLNNDEVIAALAGAFSYLEEDSMNARKVITLDQNTPWFSNTIMVFKKKYKL